MLLKRGGGLVYESREVDRIAQWGQRRMDGASKIVEKRNSPFHITLLTHQEVSNVRSTLLTEILCHMRAKRCDRRAFFPIGLSCSSDGSVWWMSVWWEWGRLLRRLLEVQSKDFHITLTQMDNISEDPYRGIDSVIQFVTIYDPSIAIEIAHGIIQDAIIRKSSSTTTSASQAAVLIPPVSPDRSMLLAAAALRDKEHPTRTTFGVVMQSDEIAQTARLFGNKFEKHSPLPCKKVRVGDLAAAGLEGDDEDMMMTSTVTSSPSSEPRSSSCALNRRQGTQNCSSIDLVRGTIGLARFATSADIKLCESERYALLFHLATRMNQFPSLAILAHSNCLRFIHRRTNSSASTPEREGIDTFYHEDEVERMRAPPPQRRNFSSSSNGSSSDTQNSLSGPGRTSQGSDLAKKASDEFFRVALNDSLKYFWLPLFIFDGERKALARAMVLPSPQSILDSVGCLYVLPPLMLRADALFIADAGLEVSLFSSSLPRAQISRLVGCLEEDFTAAATSPRQWAPATQDEGSTTKFILKPSPSTKNAVVYPIEQTRDDDCNNDWSPDVFIFDGKSRRFLVCPPRLAWIVPWKMAYARCPRSDFDDKPGFIARYRRALELASIEQICFLADNYIVVWDLRSDVRIPHPDTSANIVLIETN